ncbi:MAG: glycosyltransferase [Polaromonas sp.]|uniref:TIGR04282 family arsenosugar biosynthesis glycosyltransferase n=1 Tax=Polaromonas sp. TaxID=1869339 RepID=UPI0018034DB0|nr:TIGR04282 family arsenosugar biosynthesis glycosyltransferase [Polaromonas sp.]NMM10914.1 glycosyltransferase [Polaromonas sp.]
MNRPKPRLIIFAKAPQSGAVKTRLISALGADGAATLARSLLMHTLQQAMAAGAGPVELCMSPPPDDRAWHGVNLPPALVCTAQGEGDLGERMARAIDRVTTQHQPALLMGTDCPALTAERLAEAASQLERHDAVLLPVADGGYVLIGLKAPCPEVFTKMPWSTSTVAAETLRRMAAIKLCVWKGPTLHDIDEPSDLVHLPAELSHRPFFKKN